MPSYADATYVETRLSDGTEVADSELELAETLLDQAIGWHGEPHETTGRSISDITKMVPWKLRALQEAVVEQVRFQRLMGEDHFVRPQMEVSTPEFSRKGTMPLVAPAASRLLAQAGLINRVGGITSQRDRTNWEDIGWRRW